ncbi:uncharacterized protein LOC127010190 [Eriocheir sinensis]|uniref:uncharacterized protein LOC127010190 n=1 Tax=Eriocheir sinensis TaxID=95602 RepID=UPI0021C854BA|nr:uncharacterized protein LOC127010190 [Eriocheir sinensis]
MPKMSSIVRTTNRLRQARRPKQPKDLNFTWVTEELPDNFVQHDMVVGSACHVIMFTALLLSLLSKAKMWYVDATFKAVQRPFQQLWSIHSFIRQGDNMKQVPLVYVLMSRRSKEDYIKILNYIMERVANNSVKRVVMDFESAVWGAFQNVNPDFFFFFFFFFTLQPIAPVGFFQVDPLSHRLPIVTLTGCCFHWAQAVWKKINELGLAPSYRVKKNTSRFL